MSLTSTPTPVLQGGPFAAQHAALEQQLQTCRALLDDVLRVLHTDAPSASAAARGIEWAGPAALAFAAIAAGTESTRTLLVDTAESAVHSYTSAIASLAASA